MAESTASKFSSKITSDGKIGQGGLAAGVGGTDWQSTIVTGTTLTAVAGKGYWINTTSNACTITLPASASVGDFIEFSDYARTWGTNAVTLNTNSLNYQGNTSPNPEYNTDGQSVKIIYSGATQGWIPSVDDDVTLETPSIISADILIVAGGGGGSSGSAGGGGAGGLVYASSVSIPQGESKTVTVGSGGSGTTGESSVNGSNGNDSSFTGQTTAVGGGGGGNEDDAGSNGGSGGGGGINGTGGSGTSGQGNDGGDGFYAGNYGAGGGGGAGTAGGNATGTTGGNGGDGVNTYSTFATATSTGDSGYYAGGGGGSVRSGTQGTGGSGGGTNGVPDNGTASNATANTGGGGGGAAENGTGGNGGSGIVIVRYSDTNGQLGTGGTVTQSGGYYYHTFTSSGTFTNAG